MSPESLTFPLLVAVCSAALQVVDRAAPGAATSVLGAAGVSIVFGGIVVLMGLPTGERGRWRYLVVGMINVLVLTAAILGVSAFITDSGVTVVRR